MYGSGSGRQTRFDGYDVYEVVAPAPEYMRGWRWELHSTSENAGPYTYEKAVAAGAQRVREVRGNG